ncbi:hypothetical protein [Mitsuokella multacida]|uniref:hypothetical protein n=1 Tax=Mitsuokella multacida TaxID=52226 RepID=UPI003FA1F216
MMNKERAGNAVKAAQLCELMACAIRRDVEMMRSLGMIGESSWSENNRIVSETSITRKIVDLRRELLKLRDLL